ncbi:hypothetical protein GCM10027053_47990 [Intrasporangium mesophilum]
MLVKGDGSLGSAPITAIEDIGLAPCAHLLSKAGHLVAPIGSRITSSTGHHTAEELLVEYRASRRVRLEIISHADLPHVSKLGSARMGAASAFGLFNGQVLIPQPVATLRGHERALGNLLKTFDEPVERVQREGWLVLRSGRRLADLAPGRPMDLAAEANPLTTLMAWEATGEGWSIRSPLTRVAWTQRALASLAAAGIGVSVAWQPGYLPVEARIALGAAVLGHYDVVAAQSGDEPCLGVDVEGRGALVLGGAMVDARFDPVHRSNVQTFR